MVLAADYARKGSGGPRPVRAMAGSDGSENPEVATKCQTSSCVAKKLEVEMAAGWACQVLKGALSALLWQALRFVEGDSSISARMTRRSSVAEITGKRMTSKQASEKRRCNEPSLRPVAA